MEGHEDGGPRPGAANSSKTRVETEKILEKESTAKKLRKVEPSDSG